MNYQRHNDRVTIEMDANQFNWLLVIMGYAACSARQTDHWDLFHSFVAFLNELNADNPEYVKFEVGA